MPIPALMAEEQSRLGILSFNSMSTFMLESVDGERVIVSLTDSSVTGTERDKPQIRVITDKITKSFLYSKIAGLRFFAFVICKTDATTLKMAAGIVPDDYLVSLETSFDTCGSGRVDIRSMYDTLATNSGKAFFRLSKTEHTCGSVEQAAFIRISDSTNPIITKDLQNYMTYFDNRPYMMSVKEGSNVVYQPSAIFEKALSTDSNYPWNMLVFGAPGTGKSYFVDEKIQSFRDALGNGEVFSERVTFHSDYAYQQFVGGYMPVPKTDSKETIDATFGTTVVSGTISGNHITYEFVPGPLAKLLARAYISKMRGEESKYVLIIEEMNRANAAGVFGDIFQMLDRDKGVSTYFATVSDAFAEFIYNEVAIEIDKTNPAEAEQLSIDSFRQIKLPENLYLWATMNSADQGVFPLDSAFKRRWTFLYKDINTVDSRYANRPFISLPNCSNPTNVRAENYDWNTLRKAINKVILDAGFDEDRCIGYWFFSEEELVSIETHTTAVVKVYSGDVDAARQLNMLPNPVVDKLLSYLRQDVFRNIPNVCFNDDCKTLSAMRHAMNCLEIGSRKPVGLVGNILLLSESALQPVPSVAAI